MVKKVGNLRAYCNGKIFVGPDWKSLIVSFLLILLPSILYLAFIALKMGPDIFWLGFFLILFNLTMLALTGLSNPGVIPRRPAPPGPNLYPLTRTKDYQINGYTVSTKYCNTCQIYRVPRCSHCAMSDNCVEKFDHYCPWVGTCIGRRNYRFFLMFVFSGTFLCLLVCATSLSRLVEVSDNHDDEFDTALKNEPIAIALVIYTFAAVWFLGGLSVFHTYLVLTNQTTYEHIRRRFGQHRNPYNKGVVMNLFEACCQPNPPYDWENDGSQVPHSTSSSKNVDIPEGIQFDPTVIAMQQAVREQAEKAKRINSRQALDMGSSSYVVRGHHQGRNAFRDEGPSFHIEEHGSFCSSTSSLVDRQMGVTSQMASYTTQNLFSSPEHLNEENRTSLESARVEVTTENEDEVNVSVENHTVSSATASESVTKKTSSAQVGPSSNIKDENSENSAFIGGRSRHTSRSRDSHFETSKLMSKIPTETEMTCIRTSFKKATNPFADYADQSGEVDSSHLEMTTTLSSLTSNATSEISTSRMRGIKKNEPQVMSMEEIMSSHRSFSEMRRTRSNRPLKDVKQQQQQQQQQQNGTDSKSGKRGGSDSVTRLASWRSSGENMLSNIRALIKKPSQSSQEKRTDGVAATEQVIVDVAEDKSRNSSDKNEKSHCQADSSTAQEEKIGQKTWVPQIPVLSQKKYTELKETPSSSLHKRKSKSISEDAVSHEWLSTDSTIVSLTNPSATDINSDDYPPHRIDMPKLSEEECSDDKADDPEPLL